MKNSKLSSIYIVTFLFLITITIFFTACENKNSVLQKTSLRLRWITQSQFAGIYWAQEKGYFEREGLDVTINPGGPGINFMQVVGTGAEEFGVCGATQIIEARDKGLPVVALAIIFQGNPNIFFAKKESNIKSPKDWIGKTVAVFYGYDHETIYRAMLKRNNINPSDVKEFPITMDMTPFFSDKVDVWGGYVINQPNTAEEKGYEITRIFPDDYGINVAGDILFTTEDVIKKKPELVQKVVNAVLDGWRDALKNQEEAVNIVLSLDEKLNREHETKMIKWVEKLALTKDIDTKIGWMSYSQWDKMVSLWNEFGVVDKTVSPEECFDMQFVNEYYKNEE